MMELTSTRHLAVIQSAIAVYLADYGVHLTPARRRDAEEILELAKQELEAKGQRAVSLENARRWIRELEMGRIPSA